MTWRAFYADGSVYDESIGYDDLPREGMVGVVELQPEGRRQQTAGCDWYWWSAGRWHGKLTGEWGTWKPKPGCCNPIRSTTRLPEDEYEAIRAAMREAT